MSSDTPQERASRQVLLLKRRSEEKKSRRALLRDADWHPSALPMDLKRLLLTSWSTSVRRMRMWYKARLTNKTFMRDRHAGDPVTMGRRWWW